MPGNIHPDESIQDIVLLQQEKAAKRFLNVVRSKASDLTRVLWSNAQQAFLDQHPGKAVPFCFSKWYGPILPTTPRRQLIADGGNNFTEFAIEAVDKDFIVPRGTNIVVNREGAFYLTAVNFASYYSNAAQVPTPPPNHLETGDIFDSVLGQNGGANLIGSILPVVGVSLSFDVVLYDRKRGRRLHDEKLPMQFFDGYASANKEVADPIKFDTDTEIEPRIFVTEAKPTNVNTWEPANPISEVFFLNVFFKGYKLLEVI